MISPKRCAVFTIVKDEATMLPVWLRYYRRWFDDGDIYVLDHDSQDGSTQGLGAVNVVPVHNDLAFDHHWLLAQVKEMQRTLLGLGYQFVLFAEVDEMIVADPAMYSGLDEYITLFKGITVKCLGYEMYQHLKLETDPIDWGRPVFDQRQHWQANPLYCKTLLSSVPLDWTVGFHQAAGAHLMDPNLQLIHLHYADLRYCLERHAWKRAQKWDPNQGGLGIHNREDAYELAARFDRVQSGLIRIPYNYTGRIL